MKDFGVRGNFIKLSLYRHLETDIIKSWSFFEYFGRCFRINSKKRPDNGKLFYPVEKNKTK